MIHKALVVGMALAGAGAPLAAAEPATAPELPQPFATPSAVNFSKLIGWPEGKTPEAPPGFTVSLYAGGLDYPRWLYVSPNGDVLVSEARTEPEKLSGVRDAEALRGLKESGYLGESANQITLLRDADGDGRPELKKTFIENLNQPFGMVLVGDMFYVANTDAIVRFPYEMGRTRDHRRG